MIIDSINNAYLYYGLGDRIAAALRYLQETDLANVELGRRDIIGDDCYALAQEYDTKSAEGVSWEAHGKYIDVQFIVSGQERMGYANMEALDVSPVYDEDKDVVRASGEGDLFLARAGTFVIFMPQDAHIPGIAVSEPERVRKVVVKVRV